MMAHAISLVNCICIDVVRMPLGGEKRIADAIQTEHNVLYDPYEVNCSTYRILDMSCT